jgi:hypothetical protein
MQGYISIRSTDLNETSYIGGPVLGGPIIGGPVLGGSVLGDPVLGGTVLGSPVLGGFILSIGPLLMYGHVHKKLL